MGTDKIERDTSFSGSTTMSPKAETCDKIPLIGEDVQSDNTRQTSASTNPPPLTQRQKTILVAMGITYLCMDLSFSILAPFYPIEAKKKGVSTTVTGLVFGCFHLVIVITSPVIGKYLPVLGAKFLFLTGVGLSASSNIIFGILHYIEDTQLFAVSCFVFRSIEALGISSAMTSAMAIIPSVFPNHVAQTIGAMETCLGVGLMIGPAIGSLFYKIGGYVLPFVVLGGVCWIVIFVNTFVLPSVALENHTPGSVMKILAIPAVYPTLIGVFVGGASMVFLDPTLPIHLSSYNVSPETSGLVFLLLGGAYGLTNPLWGYASDKWKLTRTLITAAYFVQAVAMLMVGPPNLPFIPQELWIIIVGVAVEGVALACVITPSFIDVLDSAVWYGFPNDLSTYGVISGIFNSSFSLGSIVGPILGSYLVDKIGFQNTSTSIAGVSFIVMLMLLLFSCWEFRCGRSRRPPLWTISNICDKTEEKEEHQVLLQGDTSQ